MSSDDGVEVENDVIGPEGLLLRLLVVAIVLAASWVLWHQRESAAFAPPRRPRSLRSLRRRS